jgi:hypothetical protein
MSQIRKRYEDKIKQELGEEEYVIHTKRRMELIQSNLKMEFLAAYGNKCECCSETIPQFLTLDHIEGGGIKHRRSIPGGNVYRALKKEGWPKEGYRILCMNCNFATRFGAICPHIRQKFDLLLAVNP